MNLGKPTNEYNDDNFEEWYNYYESWAETNKIKKAIWSIFGKDLNEVAFKGNLCVTYSEEAIDNIIDPTWGDLFKVGDKLIRLNGNVDHVFIEHFEQDGDILRMWTGS